ncbi:phage holin family protein [Deinococcus sp.]|uniref:phage holin family protein n=1 Tax=Deinococcus sp. TaxID=47478 RepID=UPI0025C5C7B1|nr:phage holin family protein [Deinococcus sp.]
MEERKSMGSALVDVFDAGVVLVKSEIKAVGTKVAAVVKAKGIGVVILLGAVGPLLLGLLFLILFLFYGLMRLGLGAWAAALLIALVSLALAGAMVMLGLQKLSTEIDTDPPRRPVDSDQLLPGSAGASSGTTPGTGPTGTSPAAGHAATGVTAAAVKGAPAGAVPLSSVEYPVGDVYVDRGQPVADADGYATLRVEGGTTTVPVYESRPDGETQIHGSGLNKKLEGHDHHDDPNLQNPVVLHSAPGISVSTDPTFREDMKKEGY